MKARLIIPILAVVVVAAGGYFYFTQKWSEAPATDTDLAAPSSSDESSATNYDECIAEGNKPLPDAPDKCLTKDGHLFIQGVVE